MPTLNGRKYPYKKFRRGRHILSVDELTNQDFVFWNDQLTPRGWFLSWQLRMILFAIGERGVIYYAIKEEQKNA